MRYRIRQGNVKLFNASWRDEQCQECNAPINEGDPIGYLREPHETRFQSHGPLCATCTNELGRHTSFDRND